MSDMEPRAFNRDMLAKTVSSFAIHLLVFSHAGCLKSTQHLLGKVGRLFLCPSDRGGFCKPYGFLEIMEMVAKMKPSAMP